jgi:RNA polymerase sigma-70 factor, ECF subfamily
MPALWDELRTSPEQGSRRLVAEFGNRLYAAALLLCRNAADAEDLVFRTFERAVERIDQYRPNGEFYGWLYVIMLNFRRMDLRKSQPDVIPLGASQDLPDVPDSNLADSLRGVDAEGIRAAVRKLPHVLSEAVVLRFFEGRSLEEMAEMLEIPLGTVKSRLHNAKAALREILG